MRHVASTCGARSSASPRVPMSLPDQVNRLNFMIKIPASAAAVVAASCVFAQSYPSQPIKLVLPQPPGSGTDVAIRLVADRMAAGLKQAIVVDNRSGASGAI